MTVSGSMFREMVLSEQKGTQVNSSFKETNSKLEYELVENFSADIMRGTQSVFKVRSPSPLDHLFRSIILSQRQPKKSHFPNVCLIAHTLCCEGQALFVLINTYSSFCSSPLLATPQLLSQKSQMVLVVFFVVITILSILLAEFTSVSNFGQLFNF